MRVDSLVQKLNKIKFNSLSIHSIHRIEVISQFNLNREIFYHQNENYPTIKQN